MVDWAARFDNRSLVSRSGFSRASSKDPKTLAPRPGSNASLLTPSGILCIVNVYLGDRSAEGQRTLTPSTQVPILVPQPDHEGGDFAVESLPLFLWPTSAIRHESRRRLFHRRSPHAVRLNRTSLKGYYNPKNALIFVSYSE